MNTELVERMKQIVTKCFCVWSDLLGFSDAFRQACWTFDSEAAFRNLTRMQRLEDALLSPSEPLKEVAFVLNDGLARVFDYPRAAEDPAHILFWLHSVITRHWMVNSQDQANGSPGLRSVLAFGQRVQLHRGDRTRSDLGMAIHYEGAPVDTRVCVYSPAEFQMNLAFSKAYMLESLGSKAGLRGPELYIEREALDALQMYIESEGLTTLSFGATRAVGEQQFETEIKSVRVAYVVERGDSGQGAKFEIFRIAGDPAVRQQVMAVNFSPDPVVVSHKGIEALLYRVRSFQPIDEPPPFIFDFDDYRFRG